MKASKYVVKEVNPMEEFDNASLLLLNNWKESNQLFPFNIEDAQKFYQYLADSNMLFSIGAYFDNKLIGYSVLTLHPHPLNHSVKICNVDGIYIAPKYRKKGLSARLILAVDQFAKKHRADYIHWHVPVDGEFEKTLVNRFEPLSNYYRQVVEYE